MSFWSKLFKRRKKKKDIEEEYAQWGKLESSEVADFSSKYDYVVNLCEQMVDISTDMDEIRREYDRVTAYLNDIQLVEGLEGEQKSQLIDIATQVSKLMNVRNGYLNAEKKISDEMFVLLQEYEDEIPAIVRRMKENEGYFETIKRDMNRLAREKIEWSVVKQEAEEEQTELRRLSKILLVVFGGIAIVVVSLSLYMKWELLPLIIVAFMATLAASYVIIRMQECATDIKQSEININYTIVLENRVKIRFVNAKNAIDYTCDKFRVKDSKELTYNYEQYIEVCKEREKLKQTNEDLDYFSNRLVRILRGLQLYDAKIWLNYADAVIDPREMVELKHELFTRRQSLRDRIEYNISMMNALRKEAESYADKMGKESAQIRDILKKVEEISKGIA